MVLKINSTIPKQLSLSLDGQESIITYDTPQQQDILGAISNQLSLQGQTLKCIKAIQVDPGPGSFTGTRVGTAIANALAYALDIPVNGQKPPVTPVYAEPPHITTSKTK
ncbi:hypothetical protein A2368_00580 [Candidatus Collierbacteria bacterium RIFOXYB1_FULL_49_13]|uniref:Gcp-like domain-containing protein n=1 Tax=Candidatus Collierbacteria bacterium RIFOXYB1_FULL_49_13 TaxID=1817728 RepID=A0A1F5FHA2_9BACT|nr:MAG: hypothetical protein A2368_00580 [Candidatus Collierbacteria bacterium RIFOXYB1_FULL_49_13]